jgi:hypothetical protein
MNGKNEALKIELFRNCRDKYIFIFTAIGAVTIMECIALFVGYNGQMLRISIGAVTFLAGLAFPNKLKIK